MNVFAAGMNELVGADPARIRRAVARLERGGRPRARSRATPYGRGQAAEAIAKVLAAFLNGRGRA